MRRPAGWGRWSPNRGVILRGLVLAAVRQEQTKSRTRSLRGTVCATSGTELAISNAKWGATTCHLRFAHDMVSEFPSLLPRGVTVAQVTLDHFVMVRIHARQVADNQGLS